MEELQGCKSSLQPAEHKHANFQRKQMPRNICIVYTERDWHAVNILGRSDGLRIAGYVVEHKAF